MKYWFPTVLCSLACSVATAQSMESTMLFSMGYSFYSTQPIPAYRYGHYSSYKIYQENIYCEGKGNPAVSVGLRLSKPVSRRLTIEGTALLSYQHMTLNSVDENYYEENPVMNPDGTLAYSPSGQPLFTRTNFEVTTDRESLILQIPITVRIRLMNRLYARAGIENSLVLFSHTAERLNDDAFQYVFDAKLRRDQSRYLFGLTAGCGFKLARRIVLEADYHYTLSDLYQHIDNAYDQLIPCQVKSQSISVCIRAGLLK